MKLITGLMTAGLMVMAMAQSNTTVEVSGFGIYDSSFAAESYLASVVEANEKTTTYHMQCAHVGIYKSRLYSYCPLPTPATYIEGPSTANLRLILNITGYGMAARTTITKECRMTPPALAYCDVSRNKTSSYIPDTRRATKTPATTRKPSITSENTFTRGLLKSAGTLTITAGKEKLTNTASASSSGMGAAITAGAGSGIGLAAVGMAAVILL